MIHDLTKNSRKFEKLTKDGAHITFYFCVCILPYFIRDEGCHKYLLSGYISGKSNLYIVMISGEAIFSK